MTKIDPKDSREVLFLAKIRDILLSKAPVLALVSKRLHEQLVEHETVISKT